MPLKKNGFSGGERIKSRRDFSLVYSGRRITGRFFVIYYKIVSAFSGRKAAFTVSKKVSRLAVIRNRLKRRMREIYRLGRDILPPNIFLIIRALPEAQSIAFNEIQDEIISLFESLLSKEHSNRVH